MNPMTIQEVYQELNKHLRTTSQKAWARKLGVSDSYVSQVVNGSKPVSDRMLAEIGIRRVVSYERINP